jgi:hypothetical protein
MYYKYARASEEEEEEKVVVVVVVVVVEDLLAAKIEVWCLWRRRRCALCLRMTILGKIQCKWDDCRIWSLLALKTFHNFILFQAQTRKKCHILISQARVKACRNLDSSRLCLLI